MKDKILPVIVLFFFTFVSLFNFQIAEKTSARTKPATAQTDNIEMPNLSGDAAKKYLERDGSLESLVEALQKAKQPAGSNTDDFS